MSGPAAHWAALYDSNDRGPDREPSAQPSRLVDAQPLRAIEQQLAFAGVPRERRGALQLLARFAVPSQADQQVGADAGQPVVLLEGGLGGQCVHELEAGLGAERHARGDGPVELDHRRRRNLRERVVQGDDLLPVGVVGGRGPGVAGRDRALEPVGSERTAERRGPAQRGQAAADQEAVPAGPVLIPQWSGWFMIAALVYSMIPPIILGRMKLPLADELHEKTLKADADMNKADWMTAGAAILGILGIGIGLWWADSVAALIISLDVLKDGITNVKAVFSGLMDQRPTTTDRAPDDALIEGVVEALKSLDWVDDADVRLHEEGAVIAGEAFVVPTSDAVTLDQLHEAARAAHDVDWKVYDVVVTAVDRVDPRRDPAGDRTTR